MADALVVLGERLRGAARRTSTDHLIGRRPLDNLGRAYQLADGFACIECHWWAPTRVWGDDLDTCPNCGTHEAIACPIKRWVLADA